MLRSFHACLLALSVCVVASSSRAQLITFTYQNGQNAAACGPLGGPTVGHVFPTLVTTHDSIALSDPGGPTWTQSNAASQLHAALAPNGIALWDVGTAHRDPLLVHGTGAVADARDHWEFTLAAPARFTLQAALNAASTDTFDTVQTFNFYELGAGALITADPGSPLPPYSAAIIGTGAVSLSATGTLAAGHYYISVTGRTGAGSFPFDGSYANSIALALDCGPVVSYCTSGVTSHGCTAQIQGSGTPSASATSGFTLDVVGMEGASQGLIFYGVSGRSAAPWGASSSFVCVKSPTQRTGAQSGGGTAGACDGSMSLDWNSFVASHPSALGAPFSAGVLVQAQGWFRDAPSPKTTMLTDAIEFAVCP